LKLGLKDSDSIGVKVINLLDSSSHKVKFFEVDIKLVGDSKFNSVKLGSYKENIIGRDLLDVCKVSLSLPSLGFFDKEELFDASMDEYPALFFSNCFFDEGISKFEYPSFGCDLDDGISKFEYPSFGCDLDDWISKVEYPSCIDNDSICDSLSFKGKMFDNCFFVDNKFNLFLESKLKGILNFGDGSKFYDKIWNLLCFNSDVKGFCFLEEVRLNILDRKKIIYTPQYKLGVVETEIIKKEVVDLLKKGVITQAPVSDINNPIMCVSKKEGKFRLVLDFRLLNRQIPDCNNWLPNVKMIFAEILKVNAKFYSKIDLKSAYNQLILNKEDRIWTSFTDQVEKVHVCRMSFWTKIFAYSFSKQNSGSFSRFLWCSKFSRRYFFISF
jgi:hypothetical protein